MSIPLTNPCTSYGRGHRVHFIQGLQHAKVAAEDRHGEIVAIAGEVIEVRFDDGATTRYRNHETVRLQAILTEAGNPRVATNRRFALLLVPSPTGNYCFSVTEDDGVPLACSDIPTDFVIGEGGVIVPAASGQGWAPNPLVFPAPRSDAEVAS
ncbi:MAG: hypothetical protein ACT4P1_03245 [Sporichthyaceae bacterium]